MHFTSNAQLHLTFWGVQLHPTRCCRIFKMKIQKERVYGNSFASVFVFRRRAGCLKLNCKARFMEVTEICQEGVETLAYFMRKCNALLDVRSFENK